MEEPLLNDTDDDPPVQAVTPTIRICKKKIMRCCTPKCQRWTLFGFAVFFLLFSILLIFFTDDIVDAVKDKEFNLGSPDTMEYKLWKETPIPMYIEFYLFNWTNPQEVIDSKWSIKPAFVQMGPYTFLEKHYRKNVVFNKNNHTLTYQTQRIWHFAPEKTKGSLDDPVTTLNPILATLAAIIKPKHAIVKMGVNFLLEEKRVNFTVTKTAAEFMFVGYEDPLLDLLKKLHLRNMDLPFSKFAWFADRNGSIDYDGTYNMYDGSDDIRKLGRFTQWNYVSRSEYYPSYCGDVNGTSGELWYPVENDETIDVFSPDLCSSLTLVRDGDLEMFGVKGNKYVSERRSFDNGSSYPEMACFSPGEVVPSGVRNVSHCKFGAPAFVSFPHFYMADPSYSEAIDGMKPNESEHRIVVAVEPNTGIPLQARVAAQINLRIEEIDRIELLKGVKTTYVPAMWFKQYATLTKKYANEAKLIILLPSVGQYTGYGILGLACILLGIFGFIMWKRFKGRGGNGLLSQEAS